jgi:hypothetical protein
MEYPAQSVEIGSEFCPNLNVLLELVANRIVGDWKILAWQLEVPEGKIEAAQSNNPRDTVAAAREVLRQWKAIRGDSASYAEVEMALIHIRRRDIADNLKNRFHDDSGALPSSQERRGSNYAQCEDSERHFPQPLKVTVALNVRSTCELTQLAKALSIADHAVECSQRDEFSLKETVGGLITKWVKMNGTEATEETFRRLLEEGHLAHLLNPKPEAAAAAAMSPQIEVEREDDDLLQAYLEHIVEKTRYVYMVGPSSSIRRYKMELDRIYVALRIDPTVAYERSQQMLQLGNEMKMLLASKGISWEKLSPEEQFHLIPTYLSELPLSSVNSSVTDEIQDQPVAEAFKQYKALVILGDPGSGKTTIVQWLALKLANALCKKLDNVYVPRHQVLLTSPLDDNELYDMGPARLPVFVRISRFANFLVPQETPSDYSLLDFLGTTHHDSHRLSDCRGREIFGHRLHELIQRHFFNGRVTLILDGLDEVPAKHIRRRVVQSVEQLIDMCFQKPGPMSCNQIVVTSRKAGYYPFTHESVQLGTVQRMNREAIDKFIDVWMEAHYSKLESHKLQLPLSDTQSSAEARRAAADLKKAVYDRHHPSVFLLASNPLLITLIAMMFVEQEELPKERARLYNRAIVYLLKEWKEGIKFGSYAEEQLLQCLEEAAFDIHCSTKQTGHIRKSDLISKLMNGVRSSEGWQWDKERFIMDMVSNLQEPGGLLIEKTPDCVSFIHLSFQEFLAGCRLLKDPKTAAESILERISDPRWKEPILLALGHASFTWPRKQFYGLLEHMLKREIMGGFKAAVPVSALLIVRAMPELDQDSVQTAWQDQVIETLLLSYNEQIQSKYKYSTRLVENSLRQVYSNPQSRSRLVSLLDSWLQSNSRYKHCTVASLTIALGHMNAQLERKLSELSVCDSPELGMPVHVALRQNSSPDVARFFMTQKTVEDTLSFSCLSDVLNADGGGNVESASKEIEELIESHKSSTARCRSLRDTFAKFWYKWLEDFKLAADRSTVMVYQDISPDLGLHGSLQMLGEQLQICMKVTEAAIGASLNMYHDLKCVLGQTQDNPGTPALLAAAQMVSCYVRCKPTVSFLSPEDLDTFFNSCDKLKVFIDKLENGLNMIVRLPEQTVQREIADIFNSVTATGMVGVDEALSVLRQWLSMTMVIATRLIATSDANRIDKDLADHVNADEDMIRTWLRDQMDIPDFPCRLSTLSKDELKSSIATMVVEGLEKLTLVFDDDYLRVERAMDVFHDGLKLLDMFENLCASFRNLEDLRQSYHEQQKACTLSYQMLAGYRIAVLPTRRGFLRLQSVARGTSPLAKLYGDRNTLKRVCQSSELYRLFIVMYGGISNLQYTSTLEEIQKALALKQAPREVQRQIMELQMSCTSSTVVRKQYQHERNHWKRLTQQATLLKSTIPIFRLSYTYRSSSSMDRLMLEAITSRQERKSNPAEIVLQQSAGILQQSATSAAESCDAAKCICASGNIDIVIQFFRKREPFALQVATALAEALVAYSDPACREIVQILSSDCLQGLFRQDTLGVVLRLCLELGGSVEREQISKLIGYSICPNNNILLEAELLASTLNSYEANSKLPVASWSAGRLMNVEQQQRMTAAKAVLSLGGVASVRYWGRQRWITICRHPFSLYPECEEDIYSMDLFFALHSTCFIMSDQFNLVVQSIEPREPSYDLMVLWKAFRLGILSTAVATKEWMEFSNMWKELEISSKSVSNIFMKGQTLLAMASSSKRNKEVLLQEVIDIAEDLVENDARKSSQLLQWAAMLSPVARVCYVLERLEIHVHKILDPVERGRKLAYLATLVQASKTGQLLHDAMDALCQATPDQTLACVLRDIVLSIDLSNHTVAYEKYSEILEKLPSSLRPFARGETHYAVEACKSRSGPVIHCDIALLVARLRDTLAATDSCYALKDEALMWRVLSSPEQELRDLAKGKLKQKIMGGYLDLTCYSARILETLLLQEDRFALDVLPYMRCLEKEAIILLKRWINDSRLGPIQLEEPSSITVCDFVNVILAEVERLDISNTYSVIKMLNCNIDICRRRAEALFNDTKRLYHTVFVETEWLYSITDQYLGLSEKGDVRSTVVQWIYRQICHNDVDAYSVILRKARALDSDSPVYDTLVCRALRVDEEVGNLLLQALSDQNLPQGLMRKLLISLCDICYNHDYDIPAATKEFLEKLPDVCRILASGNSEGLRSTFVYTAEPEVVLSQANAAIQGSTPSLQPADSLLNLSKRVHVSVMEAITSAVRILDGNLEQSYPASLESLLTDFQKHLNNDNTAKGTGQMQVSREANALRRLLSAMVSRAWVPTSTAFEPFQSIEHQILEECDPEIITVLTGWSYEMLLRGSECREDMLLPCVLIDDLLLCLAASACRTPAAFSNLVKEDKYSDLPNAIADVARSNQSFPRRQAALIVLSSLGKVSMEVAESLLSGLEENLFVSGVAVKWALQFVEADTSALQFICEKIAGGSSLQSAMICRLLSGFANNQKLTLEARATMIERLNVFVRALQEDKPIVLFRPESKMFHHPSLAAMVGDAVSATWGVVFDDNLPIPFQLGQPDGNGVYQFTADMATPIWYRYCKNLNCWYWTPYEDYSCWMPVSQLVVRKGFWTGDMPVAANQHCIRYLHQVNPAPPSDVIDIDKDWMPDV